jgi:PBSX family phage terminase large subunit
MSEPIRFTYRPLKVHEPFHASTAREKALFGAYGSGKTYALCAEAIALALEQPGSDILVIRKTHGELRDTTETVFMSILPPALFNACTTGRSGGHYEKIVFPNGSNVRFRALDDWHKHRSFNVCAIFYDEADQLDAESVAGMESRVRQRDPTADAVQRGYTAPITRRMTCFATNPAGHNWLWKRFIDRPEVNTAWFRSTSFDNPHLPRDYVERLLTYPEPWIRRYVLCQFDQFGGQIYDSWAWDTHVVETPREGWGANAVFLMGMDPGTSSPTAGLWVVQDRANHRLVGVAEYSEAGLAARVHADSWTKLETRLSMRGKVRTRIADPSIAARDRGTNMSLEDQYRRLRYSFQHGAKDHSVRIPALGQLIHNQQFVVTRDCPQIFEQLRDYRWEDLTPQQRARGYSDEDRPERPVKVNDHLVDCAQYLASRWMKPLDIPTPHVEVSLEDQRSREIHDAIRRQRLRNHRTSLAVGVVI